MSKRFVARVNAVVRRLAPAVRGGVERDAQMLLTAGGDSEDAVIAIFCDEQAEQDLRAIALWFIGRMREVDATDALLATLADLDPIVRAAAAHSLGDRGEVAAVDELCSMLARDWSHAVVEAAAYALGQIGDPRSVPPLLRTLRDPGLSGEARGMAAEQLANINDESTGAALTAALVDPTAKVRFWSAFALGEMGYTEALPILEQLAATDNEQVPGWWSVSKEAADAVAKIQPLS